MPRDYSIYRSGRRGIQAIQEERARARAARLQAIATQEEHTMPTRTRRERERREMAMLQSRVVLTDRKARELASHWHGGGGTASYQFLSTGRIVPELVTELQDTLTMAETHSAYNPKDRAQIRKLIQYAEVHGPREEQAGWSRLRWSNIDDEEL